MITLYRKNQLGMGTWRIWAEDDTLYYAHRTTLGGAEITHSDKVQLNMSGRNLADQVALEMNSRINRMLDKGYKYDREEAESGPTNQLGLITPMLAQKLEDLPDLRNFDNAFVQPKLDGHRCLITRTEDGDLIAYSRKGKTIETIPHILKDFDWLGPGRTVDGELYVHGAQLQTISSWIKREQAASQRLRYHWYDFVSDDPFHMRYPKMLVAASRLSMASVDLVETTQVSSIDQAMGLFRKYRGEGYEGAMLRLPLKGYQDGARARQLIKIKERHDAEVTVTGCAASRDGWAVLRVRTDTGKEFDISAPGSVPEKVEVLQNFDKYNGRRLTIEYAGLTNDGIPFHAVAIRWRDDV